MSMKQLPTGIKIYGKTGRLRGRFRYHNQDYELYQGEGENEKAFCKRFANFRYEVENGLYVKETRVTFGDWFTEWMEHFRKTPTHRTRKRPAGKTIETYNQVYKDLIAPSFARIRLADVTPRMIVKFFDQISEDYSDAKLRQTKAIFSNMFLFAYSLDMISDNPMDKAKTQLASSSKESKHEVFALTVEQEKLFMKYAKTNYHFPVIYAMDRAGLRIGEALALRNKDIDYSNSRITIDESLNYYRGEKERKLEGTKTESGNRKVTLFSDVAFVFKSHQKQMKEMMCKYGLNNPNDLLFLSRYRGDFVTDTAVNASIKRIVEKIHADGYKDFPNSVSCHTLRHTFATRCFEKGIPLEVISKELGHADITVTARVYVHLLPDFRSQEMQKMEMGLKYG